MSNEVHAHIFGRSRQGDREEVKMKLYNADGTEFVPGSTVTGRTFNGKGSPSASIGQNDDWYIDTDTGIIYGPKAAGTWPPALIKPGVSPNPLDVAPVSLNMAMPYPITVDCKGRTVVHLRKLTVPSNTLASAFITPILNNLEIGTPYQVTILNASSVPHLLGLYVNGYYVDPIVTSGQGLAVEKMHLPPGQYCSIMGIYTGPTDRPLAVVTKPGSPAIRRVTGSYALDVNFDINPLIFVNSSSPATITLRDLGLADSWWEGEEAEFYQEGAGAVTIAAPAGTALTRPGGATGNFVMPGRYSTVKLRCVGLPKWAVTYYTPATGL